MIRGLLIASLCASLAHAQKPPFPVEMESDDAKMGRALQEELRAHGGDIHGCYAVALAERPGLSGEVLVRMYVAPGGAVERAEVLKDDVGSGRLTECLVGAMRKWKVPKLAGSDTQQMVFPLAFKPDDAGLQTKIVVPESEGKPGPLPGGKLEARVLIDEATVGKTTASVTRLNLPQSARLALHSHPKSLELLYVVKGRAHLRNAYGTQDAAETGDLIIAPSGSAHSIEAAPLAALELIQIFVGAGPEHAYLDPKDRAGTVPAKKEKAPAGAKVVMANVPSVVRAADLKPLAILGGKGSVLLFLDDGRTFPAALERFEAEAGAQVPAHKHDTSDEILFILAGKGTMVVGGNKLVVQAGDAVHLPTAMQHSLTVTEKMTAVQLYAPGGPEQRFKTPPTEKK
jgi:quercetin dioxygenase-like cupin family protein